MGYKEELYDRLERKGFEFNSFEEIVDALTKNNQAPTEPIRNLANDLLQLREEKKFAEFQIQKLRETPPENRVIVPTHQVNGVTVRTYVAVKWDKPQTAYLRKNWKSLEVKQIAQQLGRSESSVRAKYDRTFKRQRQREKRKR
jgi:hypothetical protein